MPSTKRIPALAAGQKTTLAFRLKEARQAAGYSQVKLAKMVGCSRQFLIALEKGLNHDMGAALSIAISDTLNIPIRWLILGDPLLAYVRLSREEEKALHAFRSLSPALQKHFVTSVTSLAAIHPTDADPFPFAAPRRKS